MPKKKEEKLGKFEMFSGVVGLAVLVGGGILFIILLLMIFLYAC
jgi:hypothetical protein